MSSLFKMTRPSGQILMVHFSSWKLLIRPSSSGLRNENTFTVLVTPCLIASRVTHLRGVVDCHTAVCALRQLCPQVALPYAQVPLEDVCGECGAGIRLAWPVPSPPTTATKLRGDDDDNNNEHTCLCTNGTCCGMPCLPRVTVQC